MNFKKITLKMRRKIASLFIKILIPLTYDDLMNYGMLKKSLKNRRLFNLMSNFFNDKRVKGVEIGVLKGINAETILNLMNIDKLYLVDVWKNYSNIDSDYKHNKNFKIVKDKFERDNRITIIRDYSINACKLIKNKSLDFIYIDANHSYNYVYSDIISWFPKLKEKNSFIGGHDVFNSMGILKAINNFCLLKGLQFNILLPDWYIFKEG